tara:strand:- start:224 stop:529 length:306 start_codon:yes stop_codon:yes gene_type:complete
MKKNILILISYISLISCGGLSDAGKVLRNEKITTTDEFLVKKRDPLILPPDYKNIPQPGKKISNDQSDQKIKKILTIEEEEVKTNKNSSSVEEAILKRIGQ